MPPIEMRGLRPVGGVQSWPAQRGDARNETLSRPGAAKSVAPDKALDPGTPPVDAERVAEIRKAVEGGSYPVIPARVADAMIAAGFLLRSVK